MTPNSDQLRELRNTRQIEGEPRRRWFSSPQLDLIVWLNDAGEPLGFQLCYDKPRAERALTWHTDRGYDHAAVDEGDRMSTQSYKQTPILVADGLFDSKRIKQVFLDASEKVPAPLRKLVAEKLDGYPG